jgi:hypothetical protein
VAVEADFLVVKGTAELLALSALMIVQLCMYLFGVFFVPSFTANEIDQVSYTCNYILVLLICSNEKKEGLTFSSLINKSNKDQVVLGEIRSCQIEVLHEKQTLSVVLTGLRYVYVSWLNWNV